MPVYAVVKKGKTDIDNWLVYQNGKVIRTIPGNKMPGQEEEEDDKPTWGEVYDFMRRAIKANPGIVVK
ncbi:hypothetical protein [Proteiniphilum sp.]|uniref:hypothetical protein n=1 Tax=Proteiniphilum sp. TaxID=1926877 RepID=UPI002B200AD2|nr:hypothetical protein [Proteiniphilum sp.]MEA4919279.1 hypothetical protein [Proteiniphilum sp.]